MPSFNLSDITIASLNDENSLVRVSFRTTSRGKDPLYPATGLHFEFLSGGQEIFAAERVVSREVAVGQDGVYSVVTEVPRVHSKEPDSDPEMVIKVHAWQGERHLGTWDVGSVIRPRLYQPVS
jgi:hypothetical protein